jgi:hypothetical protein
MAFGVQSMDQPVVKNNVVALPASTLESKIKALGIDKRRFMSG